MDFGAEIGAKFDTRLNSRACRPYIGELDVLLRLGRSDDEEPHSGMKYLGMDYSSFVRHR